jgi:hypothetical protein
LYAYAMQCGWRPVTTAMPVPGPVAEAAGSRRAKLVLGTRLQGFDTWLVWHQWSESVSTGESVSYNTYDRTHYFLWLGPSIPNLRLERRNPVGALFKPVRGVGTADAEFDKRYLIREVYGPAALRLLSPGLRHAMVAGYLPPWEISGGVLIATYREKPRVENLQPQAGAVGYLAGMLT